MDRNIINYLPLVLQDVNEYKEIMLTEQNELSELWTNLDNALKDSFVEEATENGVLRYEKIFDVTPKAADTLEDRKFRILARLSEKLPYTYRSLEERLANLCGDDGFTLELFNEAYTLKVRIELIVKSQYDSVDSLLDRLTPANLIIDLDLRYNQYLTLADFTHGQLSAYTYEGLRNEVIS